MVAKTVLHLNHCSTNSVHRPPISLTFSNECITEKRDEYSDHRLWEVQRILTALKRKARNLERQLTEDRRREQEDLEQLLKEERYEQV